MDDGMLVVMVLVSAMLLGSTLFLLVISPRVSHTETWFCFPIMVHITTSYTFPPLILATIIILIALGSM